MEGRRPAVPGQPRTRGLNKCLSDGGHSLVSIRYSNRGGECANADVSTLRASLIAFFAGSDIGCFAEQSDYITFNGMHLRGRAENSALHSALFRGVLKGTRLSAEIESIVPLSSGIALVHTAGSGRKSSYQTYVLVKSGADWLIRSFQNTRVQPLSVWFTRWAQRRADHR
jgi:uncharacterized protein (TIGR02246 family)